MLEGGGDESVLWRSVQRGGGYRPELWNEAPAMTMRA
jgi:hypothetical protein